MHSALRCSWNMVLFRWNNATSFSYLIPLELNYNGELIVSYGLKESGLYNRFSFWGGRGGVPVFASWDPTKDIILAFVCDSIALRKVLAFLWKNTYLISSLYTDWNTNWIYCYVPKIMNVHFDCYLRLPITMSIFCDLSKPRSSCWKFFSKESLYIIYYFCGSFWLDS